MKWKEEHATGIERVDEQHRTLFKAADDFRIALAGGRGAKSYFVLLDFLASYAKRHFRFEERCMLQHSCPVAEQNKEAHSRFLANLYEFQQRYETGGYKAADALQLINTLEAWLDAHICHIDIHLRSCVLEEGDDATP